MKTIKKSKVKSLEVWSGIGKLCLFLIGMCLYFAIAGYIIGYTEKAQLRDAVREGVIEACDNGATCIIKLDK